MSREKKATQLARPEPSVAMMLQGIIDKGITAETISVLEAMTGLYERMQAKEAEKDYAAAFHALMAEIPKVVAMKPVTGKDGSVKYYVAPLDEIDKQLRPMASKHGFTYRWAETENPLPDRITETCVVQHLSGHKEISPYTVRRSAPIHANDSQADVATHQYARRGSLCDAFGIVIDHDDDARLVGKPITKAEAEDFEARVTLLKEFVHPDTFLKYAGAVDFESIPDSRYDELDKMLKKWEAKAEAKRAAAAANIETGVAKPAEQKNEKGEFIF